MFLFFIYLKCMKILDNAQSIYRGSEYGLTEALPPPHVNSSLQKGLSNRRDVMRRGVSALCATWRSNAI